MSDEIHIKKENDNRKVPIDVNKGTNNIDVFTTDQDEDYLDSLIEEQQKKVEPRLTKNAQVDADQMRFRLFAEQKKVKSDEQISKDRSRKRSSSRRIRSKSSSTNRSVSSKKSKDVDYNIEKLTQDIDYDKIKDESRRERSALRDDYERERSRSRIKSRSRSRSKKPESGGIFSNLFNMNKDSDEKDDVISIESEEERRGPEIVKGPMEIMREKQDILFQFQRLEKRGVHVPKDFTMSSDIDDLRYEFNRIREQLKIDNSISFSRKGLMFVVSALEMMNTKYDPLNIELDGWSENIMDSMNEYDDIFEELYYKYKDSSNMAPEMRLLLSLSGSAFMFHITNSMFKSKNIGGGMPNMNGGMPNMNGGMPNMNRGMPNKGPNMMDMMGSMMGNMMGRNMTNANNGSPYMREDMSPPDDIDLLLKNTGISKEELNEDTSDEEDNIKISKKKKNNELNNNGLSKIVK